MCKHVGALLSYVAVAVEDGCNVASTSKLQRWHQPSKNTLKTSAFLSNMDKPRSSTSVTFGTNTYRRDTFDPRTIANRKSKNLAHFNRDRLAEIYNGKAAVLLYSAHHRVEHPLLSSEPDIDNIHYSMDGSTSSHVKVSSVSLAL